MLLKEVAELWREGVMEAELLQEGEAAIGSATFIRFNKTWTFWLSTSLPFHWLAICFSFTFTGNPLQPIISEFNLPDFCCCELKVREAARWLFKSQGSWKNIALRSTEKRCCLITNIFVLLFQPWLPSHKQTDTNQSIFCFYHHKEHTHTNPSYIFIWRLKLSTKTVSLHHNWMLLLFLLRPSTVFFF